MGIWLRVSQSLPSQWDTLQRLYSTFANGSPGKGLFLLRLVLSAFLFCECLTMWHSSPSLFPLVVVAAVAGSFLLAGRWTPLAGALVGVIELCLAFMRPAGFTAAVLAAAIGCALALLGPGAWSMDARSYGRKRISL